jgi:predicted P-loop ATPase
MFKDKDNAELKALSTAIKIKVRRPYGRFMMEKHRLVSFCATGNQEKFLSDETGNRRWLCFLVSQIDDPRGWDIDYGQLYAQLRDEYHADFHHWFSQEDQKRVERQNEYFRIVSDEEELLTMRFRKPRHGDTGIKFLKAATIAQMISYGRTPASSRKVGIVLRKLGFEWCHTNSGNPYRVIDLTPDQAQLELLNNEQAPEPTASDAVEQDLPF